MQFSHALILAFVASVSAQTGTIAGDVAALPDCAKKCIDTATLNAGCKSVTDYACQCGSAHDTINNAAAPCVASTCQPTDLTTVLSLTAEICKLVAAGAPGSGGGSSAAESSTAASSTENSSSETAAPTGGSSSTETSAPSSSGTSAPSSTGGGAAPSSTGTGESSTGASEPTTSGGSAAPTSSTGAAATGSWNFAAVAAGAGVVAAGLM